MDGAHDDAHGDAHGDAYDITLATAPDIADILDLQDRNLAERGGALSTGFSRAWFEGVIAAMPVILARRAGRLAGYLVSSPLAIYGQVAIVQAMLRAYPGAPDAYVYGPICVDETERGRGLAGLLFADLRARLPGREGVLFIRRDNAPSLRAHARMGMREVGAFEHGGFSFAVLSYVG